MVCAVSRELRYPVNNPSVMIGVHCAGTPSSSKAKVAEAGPMLLASVGDNVHHIAAVTESAQLVEREERGAGEVRFHAQHAIKFDGMPDGFVDLQPELRAIENDVEHAFGTLVGVMQSHGFFGDAAGILDEVQFINQFVSFVLPLSAERIRIRPLLNFISRERVGSIARA